MDTIVGALQVIQNIHQKYKLTKTFGEENKNLLERCKLLRQYLERIQNDKSLSDDNIIHTTIEVLYHKLQDINSFYDALLQYEKKKNLVSQD